MCARNEKSLQRDLEAPAHPGINGIYVLKIVPRTIPAVKLPGQAVLDLIWQARARMRLADLRGDYQSAERHRAILDALQKPAARFCTKTGGDL